MAPLTSAVTLAHVLSAFGMVAGYVGTNAMTEAARRSDDLQFRRTVLGLSGRFDQTLMVPSAVIASLSGLLLTALNGYAWTTPWVAGSIALYLAIFGLGITVWRRLGGRVAASLAAGDNERLSAVLHAPRAVVLSRLENAAFLLLICLMILRPS